MTRPRKAPEPSHLSVVPSPDPVLSQAKGATAPRPKSLAKVFVVPPAAGVLCPVRMRAEFPDIWARYLRANFGSAERVAVAFGVTFQCACNWLNGTSRPTGDKVALIALTDPAGLARATAAQRRVA